ncbi:MAG: BamA/TamA family outer membrane protein [Ignavibacteria bacterium]|nr:BamA/TamA family outer membrane protein [Ignavibacteria bacterium]
MKANLLKRLLSVLLVSLSCTVYSQSDPSWFSGYKEVVPASRYEAGWLHEFFFGAHWRDIWTTKVKVGVIDLTKYGGGLTPDEKGGGLQTKALKFNGTDGKVYKFRSLDKDPQKTLPAELQESIAKDVVQDQISSSNPYAGFVVNPILDAVGVYHSEYTLAMLPDDPALGEYREEFAGLLGIMEVVPSAEQFEGSDKVISTLKLFERLNKESGESVDGREFLKARLVDIFLGDWDRHKDQWKWIRYDEAGKKMYKPFPLDRDQAFAKFDGLLPFFAEQNLPQLNNFGEDYPKMRYMTWSGRYLDQRFLTFLSKSSWDDVTAEVISKITNDVIEKAVKNLPPEVYHKARKELTEKLKSRRDQLMAASNEYYELVNSVVDIYTTDKDDFVRIGFNVDRNVVLPGSNKAYETLITVFRSAADSGKSKEEITRQKYFDNTITCEIRIYLQDGDDRLLVSGKPEDAPVIRVIGGDGKDLVINKSDETIYFYDDGKKSRTEGNVSTDKNKFKYTYEKPLKELKKNKKTLSKEDKDKLEEKIGNLRYDPVMPPDKFGNTFFYPIVNYSPDIGIFAGGNYSYYKYGFRMNPYLYKLGLSVGYAPKKEGITGLYVDINNDFRGLLRNTSLSFQFRKSGIEVNNYFGQGNQSIRNDSLADEEYYKVEHEELFISPSITFPVNDRIKTTVGAIVKYFNVRNEDERRSYNDMKPYGGDKLSMLGALGNITIDGRDYDKAPFNGYYGSVEGSIYPKVFNTIEQFGKVSGDLRGYMGYKERISLGLRIRGEKVFGNYPFFESAFLGGSKLLRGFASERFAGDASVLASAELGLTLFKMNLLLPETIGLFGFIETGRVFLENEDSKKWHASYGGGLYMFVLNRDITLRFTLARSEENNYIFYFGTGFGF